MIGQGSNKRPASQLFRRIAKKALRAVAIEKAPTANDFRQIGERVEEAYPAGSGSPRILLVTSNGAGLGHLTRVNAISGHLCGNDLIYTMSSAYRRLHRESAKTIYFPSYGDLGMAGGSWNTIMKAHFQSVFEAFSPDAVVFDGTFVYRGLVQTVKNSSCPLIWLQRGCWRDEVDKNSEQRHHAAKYVDHVIIPGDYGCAESVDVGPGIDIDYVAPIVSGNQDRSLSCAEARSKLGLPENGNFFLIQLGAGVINDTRDYLSTALEAVRSLGEEWEPVVVQNPLSPSAVSGCRSVEAFPLIDYLAAFDAGVFAGGYNSCQEAVARRLPAVFVPNKATKTDDQVRRVSGLEARGLGLLASNPKELYSQIQRLQSRKFRETIRAAQDGMKPASGAAEAASIIFKIANNNDK